VAGGRSYYGGGGRGFAAGSRYYGSRYYYGSRGWGYYRGGIFLGLGPYYGYGYYPYGYGYGYGYCEPNGYYDSWGNWIRLPGCAVPY
jgi:hypothetical protein